MAIAFWVQQLKRLLPLCALLAVLWATLPVGQCYYKWADIDEPDEYADPLTSFPTSPYPAPLQYETAPPAPYKMPKAQAPAQKPPGFFKRLGTALLGGARKAVNPSLPIELLPTASGGSPKIPLPKSYPLLRIPVPVAYQSTQLMPGIYMVQLKGGPNPQVPRQLVVYGQNQLLLTLPCQAKVGSVALPKPPQYVAGSNKPVMADEYADDELQLLVSDYNGQIRMEYRDMPSGVVYQSPPLEPIAH